MKVAIIGSRAFENYDKLCEAIAELPFRVSLIVSGGAMGADTLAERWAKDNNINSKIHKPDWAKYGKGAGVIRNRLIIDECEFCLAFWDGSSKGTKSSIDYCKKVGKRIYIVKI